LFHTIQVFTSEYNKRQVKDVEKNFIVGAFSEAWSVLVNASLGLANDFILVLDESKDYHSFNVMEVIQRRFVLVLLKNFILDIH